MSTDSTALRPKRVAESEVMLAQVMLPEDANPNHNVHGGTLMKLADSAGASAAIRHARSRVVTRVMDSMTFGEPVYVGNLVVLRARVTWTGRTSIESEVLITAENMETGEVRDISTAYLVYVALDAEGRPRDVPPVLVERADERRRWEAAERRRANRLGQGGERR
jgi:acyl-CoA hydrolase